VPVERGGGTHLFPGKVEIKQRVDKPFFAGSVLQEDSAL
jgi:hypothetical protein